MSDGVQTATTTLSLLGEAVVTAGGWYAEAAREFADGLLVARGEWWRRPAGAAPGPWFAQSRDGGATWQPYALPGDGRDHRRAVSGFTHPRRDGSVLGWDAAWNTTTPYDGRPGTPIAQAVRRARNVDALVRGESERAPATVWLPYLTPLVGDDSKTLYTPAIWGRFVETEDGTLIQGTYPVLAYDRAPRNWPEHKVAAKQYRACVIYSRDDGAMWHYLATVAASAQFPLPQLAEGYCEPDLLYLGAGRLLCVLRSGGNPGGRLLERMTPLVACRSADGGLSWSPPVPIAAYGVKPVLLRLRSGVIVCLAGRPGFFLLTSRDDGQTWSAPHWVTESNAAWSRCASGYGELIELRDGTLGVAYDEHEGAGDALRLVTKFRRYKVE